MTRMDPIKIAGIKNWPVLLPVLTKVKDICSFLGYCNFYHPFIQEFTHIARPVNKLTKKDAEWTWGEQQYKAFKGLKQCVTSEPVLVHPELDQPFKLELDASGFAISVVLLQCKEDSKKHLVAYYSAMLSAAEHNYNFPHCLESTILGVLCCTKEDIPILGVNFVHPISEARLIWDSWLDLGMQ
jgi:hypothetical protein